MKLSVIMPVHNEANTIKEALRQVREVALEKEIVLTRAEVTIRVRRDERGRCIVCAEAKGRTKAELKQIAEEFSQKLAQCYTYNRTVSELKNKKFQMVNEEVMEDGTIRLHVRRWVD